MGETQEDLLEAVAALSADDQAAVREFVAFLRWRASRSAENVHATEDGQRLWRFNLLEHLAEADVGASKTPAGMEVKASEALVGGVRRPALLQHPPVSGECIVSFHVPIPAGVRDLRLRFATGIRDGAQGGDRLVAFRVRANGWQVWSRASWPVTWDASEVPLPMHAGDMLRLDLTTDGLGEHQWAWAAWGEPELIGMV